MSELKRNERGVVIHSPATRKTLQAWADSVALDWSIYYRDTVHRYSDFAAFLGERFLSDFDLRDIEQRVKQ
jgi:hypothetical protein